ncbi:MmcQ/YjbR family DNA-binding protein [Rossellomorea sp. KS-H15a]|uniref:MmcQ/YjbR family DNA-binding protein n=1 Tax=Rossellomorea sp. KS-H15a TaxID=2963940 RepID=UPI0020C5E2C5|nr:MmcQ/YjbR family DNA-binding protein [Rossellomorea sp. KS-H15a]UTE77301.1 MmcQ/YjbR family DNA-binding protein [Rossellomorea sp. KS-H15a]
MKTSEIEEIRRLCLLYPEVHEHIDGFRHISFRVEDKPFVIIGETLSIKTLPATQEILLEQPGYTKAPYIGRHGWVLVEVEEAGWQAIEGLIREGYLIAAPKRLTNQVQNG